MKLYGAIRRSCWRVRGFMLGWVRHACNIVKELAADVLFSLFHFLRFIEPKAISSPVVVIVFATSSGTAKTFAQDLRQTLVEAYSVSPSHVVVSDGDFLKTLTRRHDGSGGCDIVVAPGEKPRPVLALVFLVSTSGDGQLPASFLPHWKNFTATSAVKQRCIPPFATFALGDKQYKSNFCRGGVIVTDAMLQFGAFPLLTACSIPETEQRAPSIITYSRPAVWFCDSGIGRHGQESLVDSWSQHVGLAVQNLLRKYGIRLSSTKKSAVPKLRLSWQTRPHVATPCALQPFPSAPSLADPSQSHPAKATVEKIVYCTPQGASQDSIIHLVLNVAAYPAMHQYQAGDHCGIQPGNPRDEVERFLKFFRVPEARWTEPVEVRSREVSAARATGKPGFPCATSTLLQICTWYVDLCAPPTLRLIEKLALRCVSNGFQASKAFDEATKVFAERRQVIVRLMDLLEFSCSDLRTIPVEQVIELLPPLQPRLYSIGSDHLDDPSRIHLFVRLVAGGVTSQYLAELESRIRTPDILSDVHVYCFVQRSSFRVPRDLSRPLILVGPGTGLAPLVGILKRRRALLTARLKRNAQLKTANERVGCCWLFHGCRVFEHWTYFEKHLLQSHLESASELPHSALVSEDLSDERPKMRYRLDICESRNPAKPKMYVQDRLIVFASDVARLITDEQAHVYVCGDAKSMAPDVRRAFATCLLGSGTFDDEADVEQYMHRMTSSEHRYHEDVW